MDPDFEAQRAADIEGLADRTDLQEAGSRLVLASAVLHYSYNFTWLGLPIIQMPADVIALQEIVWRVQPAAVVETGVARGGSLVFYASLLELLGGDRRVVGVDIDIRPHSRQALEQHPLFGRVALVEGSSVETATVAQVREQVGGRAPVLVVLDSNHTHEHVLAELRLYSQFVRRGSYVVVLDTVIEEMPKEAFPARPWGPGNNPRTAVQAFLRECDRFEADRTIDGKLLMTTARGGYLRCTRDPA